MGAERLAFLRFDDLTGEQALGWISDAAPGMLEREISGTARTLTLSAATVRDAYLERATRLVHGYFEMRGGKLHFEIAVEDASRHKMVQTLSVDGSLVDAMHRVATAISPQATAFATSQEEAIADWAKGDFAAAAKLDPDFGPAWLSWTQQLITTGNNSEAMATCTQALDRTTLRPPSDRAQLQVLAATLQHDPAARITALRELARLLPADPTASRALADAEMQLRQFSPAADAYRAAAQADPNDPKYLNLGGYAEGMAGDLDGARKTFEAYGRLPGQSINALDSLGEVLFINGKFQDAEQQFLQAHAKDPSFLGGDTLWKAAHARWLSGDLPGADALMKQYLEQRQKQHDPLEVWRSANWMYETGRREQAQQILASAPPAAQELAKKQLAVWNDRQAVPRDLALLKRAYENAAPAEDGLARTLYASALLQAGQREEARKLIALWPLPNSQDALQALMYPRFQELRQALK